MKFIPQGLVVVIVGMTLTGISTIVVALRYYCRYFLMGSVALYDHLMLGALLITWGNTVINYYQHEFTRKYRFGQVRIPEKRPMLRAALSGTLITWYIYRVTYILGLYMAKMSILFFYKAIANRTSFRRVVVSTIILLSLATLGITIGNIFQCQQPRDAVSTDQFFAQFDYDGNKKTLNGKPFRRGKCFNPTTLWVFSAAINLFTDVLLLIIPIPTLLSLRVPMSKRLALVAIFSVGIMAIVASCVRMWVMALWSESINNSGRFGADLLLWGQVEVNSGIICASVPFLRLLFRRRQRSAENSKTNSPGVGAKDIEAVMAAKQRAQMRNKPLEMNSLKIFDADWDDGVDKEATGGKKEVREEDEESLRGAWGPFITVPASLSETTRSRDSATVVGEAILMGGRTPMNTATGV